MPVNARTAAFRAAVRVRIRADDLRDALRVIAIRLHGHCTQRRFDMPALQTDDGETFVDKMPADPFQGRTSFQTNANDTIPPSVKSRLCALVVTEHLCLPQHLAGLANDANGHRVQRYLVHKRPCRSPRQVGSEHQANAAIPMGQGIPRAVPNTPSLPNQRSAKRKAGSPLLRNRRTQNREHLRGEGHC